MKTEKEITEALATVMMAAQDSGVEMVYAVMASKGPVLGYTATPPFICWAANDMLYRLNQDRARQEGLK